MADSRNRSYEENTYTEQQVRASLRGIGLDIVGETENDYLVYCPYHGNRDTPSFSVSKSSGTFICFNPACEENGTLVKLIKYASHRNDMEALRFILKKGSETKEDFERQLEKTFNPKPDFKEWPQEVIDKLHDNFWSSEKALNYMHQRSFEDDTLGIFKIGYSIDKDLIAVPVHTPEGIPVGVVGRSIKDKRFKNSSGLPTSKTLFNFHRARRAGDTVIICEASFDAMRIHQAGYPNVVACLGGHFSKHHHSLIDKQFSRVVIMTDNDDKTKHIYKGCRFCKRDKLKHCQGHNPGRELGKTIAGLLPNKAVYWASNGYKEIYPHGAKDAGDMTDDEIRYVIKNAVPHLEFSMWNMV